MRRRSRSLRLVTLSVIAGLLTGCASFKSERPSPTRSGTSFDARTLADPGLKRFVEANLKRRLKPWPLESWDLPKLTLAAWYFRPNLDKAVAWQVRTSVRTNLLRHMAAQRRLDLEHAEFRPD